MNHLDGANWGGKRETSCLVFSEEEISFFYTTNRNNWLVSIPIRDAVHIWLMILSGLMLCDLFRMVYFFRHDQRLNRRVLAPIRDIASMACWTG